MTFGKQLGRAAVVVGVTMGAAVVLSAPAQAAAAAGTGIPTTAASPAVSMAAPVRVAEQRTVGPYSTWGACDSDRRLYASRYGYRTYPCELHSNGYYYFKYDA